MSDLLGFISDITARNKRYCLVCFRTENERKLVPPVALAEFIKLSRLEKVSKKESACIYCEHQAEVALKLYKTLCYARHVNQMLWSLINKKMTPKGIAYLLPSKVRGQIAGPGCVKRNKLLSLLREYQSYQTTDVLVVDATKPNAAADKNSDDDLVVIVDDDERPRAPRLVPIEKLLEKPPVNNSIEAMSELNPGSLLLYPVKTSSDAQNQFLVIPNGANVKIDGNSLNIANSGPTIPVLLPNGNIVGVQPGHSNQIVLPITDNVIQNSAITVNKDLVCINQLNTVEEIISDNRKIGEKVTKSLLLPIDSNHFADNSKSNNNNAKSNIIQYNTNIHNNTIQYVPSNNVQITKNSTTINFGNVTNSEVIIPIQKASEEIDNDQICQIMNLRSEQICQISDCKSEAVPDGSELCQISDLRSLQGEVVKVEGPPEPKMKADPNIDWEDKIPMDVISFMDAKDPNAPQMLVPPPAPPEPPAPPAAPAPRTESPDTPPPQVEGPKEDWLIPYKRVRRYGRKRKCYVKIIKNDDDDPIVIN